MKKRWLLLAVSAVVSGLFLLGATYATAEEGANQMKVGKKGEVRFDQETRVGDLVLPAGEYRFVHRLEAGDHLVHFTQIKRTSRNVHPGEVKCQLEPLGKKASRTAITTTDEGGGARRITRIEVAGEDVAHVF